MTLRKTVVRYVRDLIVNNRDLLHSLFTHKKYFGSAILTVFPPQNAES